MANYYIRSSLARELCVNSAPKSSIAFHSLANKVQYHSAFISRSFTLFFLLTTTFSFQILKCIKQTLYVDSQTNPSLSKHFLAFNTLLSWMLNHFISGQILWPLRAHSNATSLMNLLNTSLRLNSEPSLRVKITDNCWLQVTWEFLNYPHSI